MNRLIEAVKRRGAALSALKRETQCFVAERAKLADSLTRLIDGCEAPPGPAVRRVFARLPRKPQEHPESDDEQCDIDIDDDNDDIEVVYAKKPGLQLHVTTGVATRLLFPDVEPGRVFVPGNVLHQAKQAGNAVLANRHRTIQTRTRLLGHAVYVFAVEIVEHFEEGIHGRIEYGEPGMKVTQKWEFGHTFVDWCLTQPEPVATALRKAYVFFARHLDKQTHEVIRGIADYVCQNFRTHLHHKYKRRPVKRRRAPKGVTTAMSGSITSSDTEGSRSKKLRDSEY